MTLKYVCKMLVLQIVAFVELQIVYITLHSSSETPKVDNVKRKKTPVKALRHENSSTVWNELAFYRERCQQLESLV